MKMALSKFGFTLLLVCSIINITSAQVAINTDQSNPDPSAMLDIQSNNKGVLIPRMSTSEREMISNPAVGLIVFDTSTGSFWFRNTSTSWKELVAESGSLDDAYNSGGPGAGRQITADEGAVEINGEDGLTVTGTRGSGDQIGVTGAGTRMFFNPNKAAFRAGEARGASWDNANLGDRSAAFGNSSVASGNNAFAVGDSSQAVNRHTFAGGQKTVARGPTSFAFGESGTLADAQLSRAMGADAVASGFNSTAIGQRVQAFSGFETVIGFNAEPYTPVAGFGLWNNSDRLFVVGNGLSVESPSPIPLSTDP
ncbi:MAG: hypothetical protein AAF242_21585, partial [Bacteroidota bacterium]